MNCYEICCSMHKIFCKSSFSYLQTKCWSLKAICDSSILICRMKSSVTPQYIATAMYFKYYHLNCTFDTNLLPKNNCIVSNSKE